MIWHIFKKDWKLLWRFSACFSALLFVLNAARLSQGRFYQTRFAILASAGSSFLPGRGMVLETILPNLVLLGSAFLIIAVVHQDAIPGLRQDWLVRPIQRRDLLLAKLLSVLLMVQVPIFAADLCATLAGGFPLTQSASLALGRSAFFFVSFSLPMLAFASLSRNLMEAIAGGALLFLGVAVMSGLTRPVVDTLISRMAVDWVDMAVHTSILLAGAIVLLGLQYFRRKTIFARWLLIAVVVVYWLIPLVPWQTALALERRLSPNPAAGNTVGIDFVPNREALADRPIGPSYNRNFGNIFVLLPIRATGVPNQSVLLGDYSTAKLFTRDGEVANLGDQMGFQIWREHPGEGESPITWGIRISPAVYKRIADQPVRVEIDYSLTLMRLKESQTLPAAGGDQRTKELGWCGTKLDEDGLQVLYGCFQTGDAGRCTSVVLENPPTGARNPRAGACRPDYSPIRHRYDQEGALGRFVVSLPFTDASINDPSVVKASMAAEATVTARTYQAQDHFVRRVVIPEIKLKDWATE